MILLTGATGFVGSHVAEGLRRRGLAFTPTSLSLGTDLRDRDQAMALFESVRPSKVINCASFVGGIQFGYKFPVDIFRNNLAMILNLLEAAQAVGVQRIVNPISNCVYPARARLFKEDELWDGPMHESVMVYGFVRRASWMGSWAYAREHGLDTVNLILSNMYGPADHFDEERSHALGALIMKFVEARRRGDPHVVVWGTGKPVREWLHVSDGAEALIRGLDAASTTDPVNIGVASGVSILDLARMIQRETGYEGEIRLDTSKPDGADYKTVDGARGEALLGWRPQIGLEQGVRDTVAWYLANRAERGK
ncbi:MAG: NAD-dependent epimerase/dehydratase family protein [Hyphomicrobiaceae bacterium]